MMHRPRRMQAVVAAFALAALLALSGLAAAPALAVVSPNVPSSIELVEQPKAWDGRAVTFRGEAIGEAMLRGRMAWLHLNDDGYYLKNVEEGSGLHGYNMGMPVWLDAELAAEVQVFGDYAHQGDVVEARGTFNSACALHGGDMDIHATELRLVSSGRHAVDRVHPWKIGLASGLSLLAAVLWFVDRKHAMSVRRGAVTRRRA